MFNFGVGFEQQYLFVNNIHTNSLDGEQRNFTRIK